MEAQNDRNKVVKIPEPQRDGVFVRNWQALKRRAIVPVAWRPLYRLFCHVHRALASAMTPLLARPALSSLLSLSAHSPLTLQVRPTLQRRA